MAYLLDQSSNIFIDSSGNRLLDTIPAGGGGAALILFDYALDNGITGLAATTTHLEILSAQPSDYATSQSLSLGSRNFGAGNAFAAPAAGTPNGWQTTANVAAITVSATGTASWWAATDHTNSRLLAAGGLLSSQAVSTGQGFTLSSFTVKLPAT